MSRAYSRQPIIAATIWCSNFFLIVNEAQKSNKLPVDILSFCENFGILFRINSATTEMAIEEDVLVLILAFWVKLISNKFCVKFAINWSWSMKSEAFSMCVWSIIHDTLLIAGKLNPYSLWDTLCLPLLSLWLEAAVVSLLTRFVIGLLHLSKYTASNVFRKRNSAGN